MKTIITLLFLIILSSCGLDESNQRYLQTKTIHYREEVQVIVIKYYDEFGNEITDPDLIALIKSKSDV